MPLDPGTSLPPLEGLPEAPHAPACGTAHRDLVLPGASRLGGHQLLGVTDSAGLNLAVPPTPFMQSGAVDTHGMFPEQNESFPPDKSAGRCFHNVTVISL